MRSVGFRHATVDINQRALQTRVAHAELELLHGFLTACISKSLRKTIKVRKKRLHFLMFKYKALFPFMLLPSLWHKQLLQCEVILSSASYVTEKIHIYCSEVQLPTNKSSILIDQYRLQAQLNVTFHLTSIINLMALHVGLFQSQQFVF